METNKSNTPKELSEADLSRLVRAAAAAVFVVALLFVATAPEMDVDVIQPAQASTAQDASGGYFPARFPTPQGDPESHVQAF
jgi:hypothetical protein